MTTLWKGWVHMMASALAMLSVALIDRLAFMTMHPEDTDYDTAMHGIVLGPGVSNLVLVMLCAVAVYAAGVSAMQRRDEHLPEGLVPAFLGVASMLPIFLFSLAISMLRG